MIKKTGFWIFLFSALIIASIGALAWMGHLTREHTMAYIYQDTVLMETIDLLETVAPYELSYRCDRGGNTVLVEHGRISVKSADCPDKLCVKQGPISDGALPIVCLPHRLVIKIEKDTSS